MEQFTWEQQVDAEKEPALAVVVDYLRAFGDRDTSRCMEFYADDARLRWMTGTLKTRDEIEQWHQSRFAANPELVRLDAVRTDGDTVTIDAVVTSKRLRAWKIEKLAGRATVQVRDGRIKEIKFSPRLSNPFAGR